MRYGVSWAAISRRQDGNNPAQAVSHEEKVNCGYEEGKSAKGRAFLRGKWEALGGRDSLGGELHPNGMTTTPPFTKTQGGVLNCLGFEVGIA